jgi:hypothetical protein
MSLVSLVSGVAIDREEGAAPLKLGGAPEKQLPFP